MIGGEGVADYRLYFFSKGRITAALDLECEDDPTAIATAEAKLDGRPIELWQRARMVAALGPGPPD